MMKKKYWLAVGLSLGMTFSCGGNSNKDRAGQSEDSTNTAKENEPMSDQEQRSAMTVKLGGKTYQVDIYRFPDKNLPLVVDELEQNFYDNSVEITILRDGADFVSKKVTKAAFEEFLSEQEMKSSMLLGMNCDTARCDASSLCFTAQVGQAGEGPAFIMKIPTNGGQAAVYRDNQQEDISYK